MGDKCICPNYPICDVLIINKMDYIALNDFDLAVLRKRVLTLNPRITILEVSCKTGAGIESWTDWLKKEVVNFKKTQ